MELIMRGIYVALMALMMTVAAPPVSADGQWCGDCISDYQTTTHTNGESPSIFFGYYGPFHFASWPGLCLFYHEGGCSNAHASGIDDHTVLGLIPFLGTGVVFNAARKSLQILSCDGASYVGNVPMTDAEIALLAHASQPLVHAR